MNPHHQLRGLPEQQTEPLAPGWERGAADTCCARHAELPTRGADPGGEPPGQTRPANCVIGEGGAVHRAASSMRVYARQAAQWRPRRIAARRVVTPAWSERSADPMRR